MNMLIDSDQLPLLPTELPLGCDWIETVLSDIFIQSDFAHTKVMNGMIRHYVFITANKRHGRADCSMWYVDAIDR